MVEKFDLRWGFNVNKDLRLQQQYQHSDEVKPICCAVRLR